MVVYRLDRISRNISDFAGLVEELGKRDVAFISIREQFDTGSPMGRAMMYIISVFSQLERETIAQRIRDNMHELAKTGRWLGGNTPTGYTSESVSYITQDGKTRKLHRLKLLPEEAETVKTIFDLYIQLGSLTAVETELLRRQLKTKRGNEFTRFALKGILENPVYMMADARALEYFSRRGVQVYAAPEAFDGSCGIMAYNRTDQEKGSAAVYLPMEEWIVSVGAHPGLIPSCLWIRVQECLAANKSSAYRQPRKHAALLTGLLFCACGSRMSPKLTGRLQPDGTPIHSYVCRQKQRSRKAACSCANAPGQALDAAVWDVLQALPTDVQTFLGQLEKNRQLFEKDRQAKEPHCRNTDEEIARNEQKLEALLDAMSLPQSEEAKQRIAQRMETLLETNRRLRQSAESMSGQPAAKDLSAGEFAAMRRMLAAFELCTEEMPTEEKRRILRETVNKVVWDGTGSVILLTGADNPEKSR